MQQLGEHLNKGDIVEIRDEGSFFGLRAECVESDRHPEFPYKCTVRLNEGMEEHRNVVSDDIPEDAMIYEEYWPTYYVVISRSHW